MLLFRCLYVYVVLYCLDKIKTSLLFIFQLSTYIYTNCSWFLDQVMAITGDHTWGWLGSTEQFGRDTNPRDFTVIPKSQICDQKYKQSTQAAHCAIYANNDDKIFGIYNARAAVLVS